MKQLKTIKSKLKKENIWDKYEYKFSHKQMKLVTTKIALVFKDKINVSKFYKMEKDLIEKTKGPQLFKEAFELIESETNYKADWKELGKFMWYAYQTSTFYSDVKSDIKNIYTLENSIELNEIKRDHFLKWLHSIDITDDDFNEKIMAVQKLVF